jgi:hypothetical protein
MRGYTVSGPNAAGTANKTLATVIASTTVRPAIFDVVVGCSATPADQAAKLAITRWTTSAGTAGSSPTPNPLDPADIAATATAGITHSAEPTYASTNLLQIPMNQRATFRWVASPGYELKNPATATTGLGLQLVTATASTAFDGQVFWFE